MLYIAKGRGHPIANNREVKLRTCIDRAEEYSWYRELVPPLRRRGTYCVNWIETPPHSLSVTHLSSAIPAVKGLRKHTLMRTRSCTFPIYCRDLRWDTIRRSNKVRRGVVANLIFHLTQLTCLRTAKVVNTVKNSVKEVVTVEGRSPCCISPTSSQHLVHHLLQALQVTVIFSTHSAIFAIIFFQVFHCKP